MCPTEIDFLSIAHVKLKAISRKFTLLGGVNHKISPDFGPNICKQTGMYGVIKGMNEVFFFYNFKKFLEIYIKYL